MTPKHQSEWTSVQLTEQPFLPLSSLSPANRPTHRGQITLLELPSGCLHLCLSIANLCPDVLLKGHPPRRAFLLHLPPLETKDSHLPAAWGTEWFQTWPQLQCTVNHLVVTELRSTKLGHEISSKFLLLLLQVAWPSPPMGNL